MHTSWLQQRDASPSFPGCSWWWGTLSLTWIRIVECLSAYSPAPVHHSQGAPSCQRRMTQAYTSTTPHAVYALHHSQHASTWVRGTGQVARVSLHISVTGGTPHLTSLRWSQCTNHSHSSFSIWPWIRSITETAPVKWLAHSDKLTGTCALGLKN